MSKSFFISGRVSYVVLAVTGVIIGWGIFSFLTPHETLVPATDNSFFETSSLDSHPDVKGKAVKTLIFTSQKSPSGNAFWLVNGNPNPVISIRPGEIQRWKMVNSTEQDFFNFSIPGLTFFVVSRDGHTTTIPQVTTEELFAPHDTAEILVQGPGWGNYEVVSKLDTENLSPQKLLNLKSESFPKFNAEMPTALVPNYDLRNASISNYKNITLTSDNQILSTEAVTPKTVEEWTITNPSQDLSAFTVQNGFFQVVEIGGTPVERYGYDETFAIPPQGVVKIRVQKTI